MTMELVRRLPERAGTGALHDVMVDAERVIQHLELSKLPGADDRELELAHLANQRLLMAISHLTTWDCEQLWPAVDGLTAEPVRTRREALAGSYGVDARSRRREALGLAVLALVALAAAVGIAMDAATATSSGANQASAWLPHTLSALMAFVAGVALLHGAQRHRLASFEATRVQRQLSALDDLLEPLPPALQALTRASILRQLFPRLREDSEPWIESAWPDSAAALQAIELDRTSPARASSDQAA
jgi:hypothetical protein